jgi:hypothetical protein
MKGQERIIKARLKGLKPAGWVMVDVSLRTDQAWLLARNGAEVVEGLPVSPYVCLEPHESARTADWSWCIGLKIQVDGNDLARVGMAHERLQAAGAARVVSSCVLSEDLVVVKDSKETP